MPDVVYFAKRHHLVKIGTTGDLRKRAAELDRGVSSLPGMVDGPVEVLAVMPGGRAVEQALHQTFAHLRYAGEWFFHESPLTDFIQAVAAAAAGRKERQIRAGLAAQADSFATLRQAVDEGLLPWAFEATKKRMQRARKAGTAVPAPVGKDGTADLYRVGDLIAWVESELVA